MSKNLVSYYCSDFNRDQSFAESELESKFKSLTEVKILCEKQHDVTAVLKLLHSLDYMWWAGSSPIMSETGEFYYEPTAPTLIVYEQNTHTITYSRDIRSYDCICRNMTLYSKSKGMNFK
jgi:hypothetical protein